MILSPTRLKSPSPLVAKAVLCSQAVPRWVSGQPSTLRGGPVMLDGQPPCTASPAPPRGLRVRPRPASLRGMPGWARAPLAPSSRARTLVLTWGTASPQHRFSTRTGAKRGRMWQRPEPVGTQGQVPGAPGLSRRIPHCPRPASPPETLGVVGGGSLCHVPSFTFMGVLCAVCHRDSWGTPDGMPSVEGPSLFWSNGFLYKISCRSSLSVLFWGGLLISLGPQIH